MRPLEEIQTRWRETQTHTSNLGSLRRAVQYDGVSSPCVTGCRSVCWKVFLLFKDEPAPGWSEMLRDARNQYSTQRDLFLRFIKHPEALTELTVDPLADDPDSPWDTVRQDEIIRAEIQQDVQRLPDEANYHDDRIQMMILDILFVYCKLNPNRGGYRQGMHELLAPMVHVMEQDAVDRTAVENDSSLDASFLDMLDSDFIEHDAFALFSRLMEHAQSFYELKSPTMLGQYSSSSAGYQEQRSTIVERSKFIHEVCLNKVDPELAAYLTGIEILPQIFLIRWVRLLFSREFPFEQFLILWDTIFAIDPSLDLIDLVCVAMLIRIRWQLLEADYSVCLQLLLKYPPPIQPHGPQTFVDDAVYLRGHLNPSGGASLVLKYTGRMPAISKPSDGSGPTTPNFGGFASLRQRGLGVISPLGSPARFNQGGVEVLFQGAAKGAKGVFQRGEKLGINQAVRDAMGEIRRNVQGFNESKFPPRAPADVLNEEGAAKALAAMERRNRQLASMLDETVANLKAIGASSLDEKAKSLELIEIAAAKVQFVQIYLEDPSMEVPSAEPPKDEGEQATDSEKEGGQYREPAKQQHTLPPTSPDVDISALNLDEPTTQNNEAAVSSPHSDAMDTRNDALQLGSLGHTAVQRPRAVPTRSTLAQSSFSWMLEPEQAPSAPAAPTGSKSPPGTQKKRPANNASRERNAFLFGEVTVDTERRQNPNTDEIFGMETFQKPKRK